MNIKRLDPSGILRPEIAGIAALEGLPNEWFGYSNIFIRFSRWDEPAEIDVVFVTQDRVFVVDLKNWAGAITATNGVWYQNGESRGASAARKQAYNARKLAGLISKESGLADPPFVEHRVVFCHSHCDIVGLEKQDFDNGAMKLSDFIRSIRGRSNYENTFRYRSSQTWGPHRPLTEGDPKKLLLRFFGDREHFQPRQLSFDGYRPKDTPTFSHPKRVYDEYECEYVEEPSYLALLRYWNFEALPTETHVAGERREIAAREHSVLSLIRRIDTDLHDRGVLKWKAHDREYNMRYWELFELERTMKRLREYLHSSDRQHAARIDLASKILGRVAQLHRHQIAHRDLGPDSIWIDQARSGVLLSAFGCAHYPATSSLREMRVRLLGASTRLPEDDEDLEVPTGTPYQQDVFLLGVLLWSILMEGDLPTSNGVADIASIASNHETRHPELVDWFRKALDIEPKERWKDAIAMHDAFISIVRTDSPTTANIATTLASYERRNPYLTYRVAEEIKDDRATIYISGAGDERYVVKIWSLEDRETAATAANLRAFLYAAEALCGAAIPSVQTLTDFGLYKNEVFTVARMIVGEPLSKATEHIADVDTAYLMCAELATAVNTLHEQKIAHGDINLENVMVLNDQASCSLCIIDIPDFVDPTAGRYTPAYSPPTPSDSFTRDRYAVCQIIRRLFDKLLAQIREGDAASKLLLAVQECESVSAPWLTLRPILTEVASNRSRGRTDQFNLRIGVKNRRGTAPILLEDDQFLVALSEQRKVLSIVGFDSSIDIALDPQTLVPLSAEHRRLGDGFLNWATKNQIACLPGRVEYYESANADRTDFEALFAQPEIAAAISTLRGSEIESAASELGPEIEPAASELGPEIESAASELGPEIEPAASELGPEIVSAASAGGPEIESAASERGSEIESALSVRMPKTRDASRQTAPMGTLQVEALWRKIIEIEEDDVLEARVTGPASHDRINGVHIIPCEFSRTDVDFDTDARPVVYVNDYRLGDVDVNRMMSTELAISNLRGGMLPAVGARLRIATIQDMDNLTRRKTAINRILDEKCLIPGLLKYFAPAVSVEPIMMRPEEISNDNLDRYGLNESQQSAFRSLWKYGPVGLLQGPPGTGKTTFIASFIHYAITRGGVNNVLLLSQSHKAVDNAIERLLRTFGDERVSLIRVGQLAKVSEQVAQFHSRAVHEEFHDLFESEAKQRVSVVAQAMGLPASYARDAFEFWSKLRAHESILADPAAEQDEDSAVRAQYASAKAFVADLAAILKLSPSSSVQEIGEALLPALAKLEQYSIRNPDLVRRFRQVLTLSREWQDALGGDRSLEPFLVKSRQIVSGTCVGVAHRALRLDEVAFDLVVIDEAAKCGPGDLAIGMQIAKRVVLVGDHQQLPPFQERGHFERLVAEMGNQANLRETDFQRALVSPYGVKVGAQLSSQYRMCPEIGDLVSKCFYDDKLHTARGESPDYFSQLPAPLNQPVSWLDTSSEGSAAQEARRGTSYANAAEASSIIRLLKMLEGELEFWRSYEKHYNDDIQPIGVICMYAAQSTYLKREILTSGLSTDFQERIKVDTVDSYQGRENPIIILSLVRNSPNGWITQHAGDLRRINVALSRAMERLVIVGSATFFGRDSRGNALFRVLEYLREGPVDRFVPSSYVGQGVAQV